MAQSRLDPLASIRRRPDPGEHAGRYGAGTAGDQNPKKLFPVHDPNFAIAKLGPCFVLPFCLLTYPQTLPKTFSYTR